MVGVERSPLVLLLLKDALERVGQFENAEFTLEEGDMREFLQGVSGDLLFPGFQSVKSP